MPHFEAPLRLSLDAKRWYFAGMKLLWTSVVFCLGSACASAPAAPFDTLPQSQVIAYRLQNYEVPQAAAPAQPGMIPGIPPEIQQWAQQALPGLQQMIPPGLLPPGVLPTPAPAQAPQAPRFHGFRILEQQVVMDTELKEQLAELLGDEDSFTTPGSNCMYSEMGISFGAGGGAPQNDVLVSFSCNQMQGHNFIWPHPSTGMKPDTVQQLSKVVAQIFPPNSAPPQPITLL